MILGLGYSLCFEFHKGYIFLWRLNSLFRYYVFVQFLPAKAIPEMTYTCLVGR